jgi:hypothetical protein
MQSLARVFVAAYVTSRDQLKAVREEASTAAAAEAAAAEEGAAEAGAYTRQRFDST